MSINRVSDRNYSAENIGLINRLVNGGGNGYHGRQAYTAYILRKITDTTDTTQEITITLPHPKRPIRANMQEPE
jgi:hydroxyethylthiazole kinase